MQAPQAMQQSDDVSQFDCGNEILNTWLKRRALANHVAGASRCFVLREQNTVLAYYALSAGAVAASQAVGNVRRNMPDPIPVLILARLAIDINLQGRGVGKALLKDALLRASRVGQEVGVRALLVHAIDDTAKAFYIRHGFAESPTLSMMLMLRLPI